MRLDLPLRRGRLAAATVVLWLTSGAAAADAQGWNDARTRALVERAATRRAAEIADSALADYHATAHGYVTFLGQFGDARGEFADPPKIVRADELALEVYWRAPDLSKQIIIGQRDSLLAPTDIQYHRDHLGIVQNNFPNAIRLGEGDEVLDVPHPLSLEALGEYDYQISDSLSLRLPDRVIDVYEVRVRPRDPDRPRVVGAVYLDRQSAEVVRMAFDFTRAAYLDRELESVSVVLENALVEGRFWLPRRQDIEIRRMGRWLDFPARGIIRGRWEICCYVVNSGLDRRVFVGEEIVYAPPQRLKQYPWHGRILDSLPEDIRAITDADVARVQEEARALVVSRVLRGGSPVRLSAHRVSDFVRVDRSEGLALGLGGRWRVASAVTVAASGRYGFADREGKGRASVTLREGRAGALELFAERTYRDSRDVLETSIIRNSLTAQEFGSDATDPYDVKGVGASVALGVLGGVRFRVEGEYEQHDPLAVHGQPFNGRFWNTIPAWPVTMARVSLFADHAVANTVFGAALRWNAEMRLGWLEARDTAIIGASPRVARVALSATAVRPFGSQRLVVRTVFGAAAATDAVPPQEYVFYGGPTTAPGFGYNQFAAKLGLSQRVEWRTPVPFVPIGLGRFGHSPATATLAPFVNVLYMDAPAPFRNAGRGWFPAVGLGTLVLFDLVRMDVARGLRDGRWSFALDVSSEFWGVL